MKKLFKIIITIPAVVLACFLTYRGMELIRNVTAYAMDQALALPQPKIEERIGESSKIYDREGNFLYEIHGEIRRRNVKLKEVPLHTRNAFLAAEDREFYSHPGFSIKRIFSALIENIRSEEIEQGASTIPQQLTRYLVLTQEKTLERKIKEILISYFLTLKYNKDQIFERYLNEIPLGGNLVGLRTAGEVYFQKEPKDLTLAESVVIAALVNAPSTLDPYVNQEGLEERAHYILQEMHDLGYINQIQYEEAINEKIEYATNIEPVKYPYFVFYVRDYLFEKYGKEKVEFGGFRIVTSLDPKLQDLGMEIVKEGVEKNTSLWGASNACLVALDPQNGQILAMVGGKDFADSEVNVTTSLRHPGSSIKPFIYLTSFENGYAPETYVLDRIHDFGGYKPTDYGGGATGSWWSIREALVQSLNIPSVATLQVVGIDKTVEKLKALNFSTIGEPQNYGLSLALGAVGLKPLEMAVALGILANEGKKLQPQPILEISNSSGEIIENNLHFEAKEQILDPEAAKMISNILSDRKTKARFYRQDWFDDYTLKDRTVAAKTGTSEGPKDTWTVGYTPNLVTVVWAGNNDGSLITKKKGADGINVAAPLWHDFMEKATQEMEKLEFPEYTKPELDQDHKYIRP